MELIPPVWATDSWVDDSWADGSWSTELVVVYALNLHTTTTLGLMSDRSTRGMTTTYTTRALGSDRSTEAI